ncbi:LLM class flavin-dependent oxidoreductase [Nonomuraea sp. NPDC005501]|uniref:LLM class flavin-dependent oxidoreductase n=1 Tax=Nonomuraea sp. NPDC005501 TaxID=3156884 RepID=UPI0033ACC56E
MPVDIYWRIHMEGDQPSLRRRVRSRGGFAPGGTAPGVRDGRDDGYSHADYMAEVARAAEESGFVGGLLPNFPHTDDPWAAAATLARETTSYRFMVAFQPGFLHPVQAARMTATLQRATGGRIVYNVISGGGGPAQLWWGDKVDHDDRYARTSEFLDVLKGVWAGGHTHHGRFYQVENAGLPEELAGQPFPEIFFSGSSPAAIAAAGRHADYYLSWLEPFEALKEKFDAVRAHSDTPPRFAVRVDLLARESEEEAWEEIRQGWQARPSTAHNDRQGTPAAVHSAGAGVPQDSAGSRQDSASAGPNPAGGRQDSSDAGPNPAAVRQDSTDAGPNSAAVVPGSAGRQQGDSVGVRRSRSFLADVGDDYRRLEVAPNVWGGFGALRDGPAFGLVGDYRQVAERLDQLLDLGVDAFILAGIPHLEEARRVGRHVLPLLKGRRS